MLSTAQISFGGKTAEGMRLNGNTTVGQLTGRDTTVTRRVEINPLMPTVAIWVAYSYKASCARPG